MYKDLEVPSFIIRVGAMVRVYKRIVEVFVLLRSIKIFKIVLNYRIHSIV